MTALILLNGPPGIGKSTLAALYADRHPGTLALDIDSLHRLVGGWRDPENRTHDVLRPVALAMASAHLAGGRDVVLPQFLSRPDEVAAVAEVARRQRAEFHEIVLLDQRTASLDRFEDRADDSEWGTHNRALVELYGGRTFLASLYDALRESLPARPAATVVTSRPGAVEETYAAVVGALRDGDPPGTVGDRTRTVAREDRTREAALTRFTRSDDLARAEFRDTNLRRARFVGADLTGVVMRGVDLADADLDSPWLLDGPSALLVNGVDVTAHVDAELNRRFPGRGERRAGDPAGLRGAWAQLERTWSATLDRVAGMPDGTVDISVAGEWSFAETLRHLVLATDAWLRKAVQGVEQPFHPLGLAGPEAADDGVDMSIFTSGPPTYAEVLEVRAQHQDLVRGFLATVTTDELAAPRTNPWAPELPETTLSCLHVILQEEWEHHRYAVRDLDLIDGA